MRVPGDRMQGCNGALPLSSHFTLRLTFWVERKSRALADVWASELDLTEGSWGRMGLGSAGGQGADVSEGQKG